MLNKTLAAFVLGLALSLSQAMAAGPVDFTDLVDESIPAVVNVETIRFGSRPAKNC